MWNSIIIRNKLYSSDLKNNDVSMNENTYTKVQERIKEHLKMSVFVPFKDSYV